MSNNSVLLLTDGKRELREDLKQLKKEMEALKQIYLRLDTEYKEKKRRYEAIDSAWAERDGRLRLVRSNPNPKPRPKHSMSQEQINELIAELEDLVKMK